MIQIVSFLILIQIKHLFVDFIFQTKEQIERKGVYGDIEGLNHSLSHGLGTMLISMCYNIDLAGIAAMLDVITHYHIDWVKANYGDKDIFNKRFWHHLGMDQFAHQIVYLLITLVLFFDR